MSWVLDKLWLVPVLPLLGAGLLALTPRRFRLFSSAISIGSLGLSLLLSLAALLATLSDPGGGSLRPQFRSFDWIQYGEQTLQLGWVLDPLSASMLVMVSFVGLLIFIYSVGYMAHDGNFTRFFCFLSLFAAAMLGLVISNNLLLLFISWELVGLASYLLIGFWHHKPSAAAAAKKAFITTRIGDLGFFLGMLWLYAETGTLLLYDNGNGCLEQSQLARLVGETTALGMAVSTGISLLLVCGAAGKSGQIPLHVWLPDAMEGPTPVSALIHAATMVAAGVYLLARMYPLLDADPGAAAGHSPALTVVTWVGAITALFAASIAVAQTDIKRILAYSTVSQLGFMMLGLGTGGVAVAMFHLITHAFFKALLFMGAGSVIHGCHNEQDIRRMGGLREFMPVTFASYAVGMMALSGFPIFFSGFWSKDEILHAAHAWSVSHWPFYLGVLGALLTVFYMTRQMYYVFWGPYRGGGAPAAKSSHQRMPLPHESPPVMTVPLFILAACTLLLGWLGTPAWPWYQKYLAGEAARFSPSHLWHGETLAMMLISLCIVLIGAGGGWLVYGRKPIRSSEETDALERWQGSLFRVLRQKYWIDELYEVSVIRLNAWWAGLCDWFDRRLWQGAIELASYAVLALSWVNRFLDEFVVNGGFDAVCQRLRLGGGLLSKLQSGQIQHYLCALGLALVVLLLVLTWGIGK